MKPYKLVNIYFYTRYERFWHWFQMLMIVVLMGTGLEIHGLYSVFGFDTAVTIHNFTGITWLLTFWVFIFWLFTTGQWRDYIPTTKKMLLVVRYYAYGIFKGEPHPTPKQKHAKHNPLQRLTYLALATCLLPIQMISGFLYWSYNSWEAWGISFLSLKATAAIHMGAAFALLTFLVVHVYMTTTGDKVFTHIRAMITGWEEVDETAAIEDWEKAGSSKSA
jgi:thiosulfate reductase cytochrome b subunit